jgi:hypothetical protein
MDRIFARALEARVPLQRRVGDYRLGVLSTGAGPRGRVQQEPARREAGGPALSQSCDFSLFRLLTQPMVRTRM